MTLAKRQQELAEVRLAEALGRPEKRCPSCSTIGAHWISDTLDERGDIVRGYFTCTPPVEPEEHPTLDLAGPPNTDGPRSSGWYGGNE